MKDKLCIIGLGYVGLPLAVEFSKYFNVVAYDIDKKRVNDLLLGCDKTNEYNKSELSKLNNLLFTNNENELSAANIYIICVPTPVNSNNSPNLSALDNASTLVSKFLKKNDIVIFESTTYPGCTEEFCLPILSKNTELKYNIDFFLGYSPERINPGDKKRKLPNIVKITSGSTPDIAEKIDILYRKIIKAGTYKASSIIVAEAAKVIENTQRDINIAFINELSIIFNLLNISTNEVLAAASTKWNFLDFKPGLVGGHCISVDPYYLAYKAQKEGYIPEIILAGRRINDSMPKFVVEKCIKLLVAKDIGIKYCKALILGVTFKEDCNDIRNSKVFDIYRELLTYKIDVDLCDPVADEIDVINSYGLNLLKFKELDIQSYNLIIIAVSHKEFNELNFISNNETVVFDVKGNFKKIKADGEL